MKKHSPEDIIEILHSITKLSVKDGELDVWIDKDNYPSGIRGYIPGSFTRELLELIEDHLLKDSYDPFARDPKGFTQVSEEDMKYLSGTPAPLKILVPVVIEDNACEYCGFSHPPSDDCLDL